jgi:4-aminobutyrate aminotransferase-like enzyme/Ser/Thr protein kinase RdoA (MazF antagonist)
MQTTGIFHADPPALTPAGAVELASDLYGLDATARLLVSERDQNFLLDAADGNRWVLKISNKAEDASVVDMEVAAVEHVAAMDPGLLVPRARPTRDGTLVGTTEAAGSTHLVRLLPFFAGRTARPGELSGPAIRGIGEITARISHALRGFFHAAAGRVILWDQKQILPELAQHADRVQDAERRALLDRFLERFADRVAPALPRLRSQVIHNDVTLDNLVLGDRSQVAGIIDFGDMAHTALVLDVPATLQSLVRGRDDLFEVAAWFLPGFTSAVPLEAAEAELLADLMAGRLLQTILISAWRVERFPGNGYIAGWAEPAWTLLEGLERTGMEQAARRLAGLARAPVARGSSRPIADAELAARRTAVLGPALEQLSYARPLHLVRGGGAWMFDADGRAYLDAYNNVPVVGHAHPRVADAIARQAAMLNTNTRYLHSAIVELAERIVGSMPDGLDTVMFVNSGSEANDLAWRLATAATHGDAGLVAEWAYHGVTAAIADFSPSEWPPGQRPAGVETFPAPDTYRGPYVEAADAAELARREMAAAITRLTERGRQPAAVFVDAFWTSSGIFVPAAPTVAALISEARAAGALYVADEVQAGHGRSGSGLWAFPAWSVVPDIVTLGKPMGNGHPIAAVVTRAQIAACLAAETTFFSTFGGNPVACAAALTVLDVIEDEGLVAKAESVGTHLRSGLADLGAHPAVGDVRGLGLMVGVELVTDRSTRAPATDLARAVRDAMRDAGVLIGTTGREGNVLKIRPPLVIRRGEVDMIVETLERVLRDLG